MSSSTPSDAPPQMRLMQYITGHWVAAAVHSAVKLGIPDQLESSEKTSAELAAAVEAHEPSVFRLMRALTSLGLFTEVRPKTFALTELGEFLKADHPQSMRSMALFQGADPHWRGWGSFEHSVRTGESAFAKVHGMGFFDYCQTDRSFSEAFNGAMTGMSAGAADAVLAAYDFSGIATLADVGGGHGYLLTRILNRYPTMKGILYDLPHVVAGAKPAIASAGLTSRCQTSGGSFFDSVPAADAYVSKHIIHDWDDEHCVTILRNMRKSMPGSGRVLLIEIIVTPENYSTSVLIDLEMLHATQGGRERTTEEFASLFSAAGLKLNRVVPTKSLNSILEGIPA